MLNTILILFTFALVLAMCVTQVQATDRELQYRLRNHNLNQSGCR